MIQPSEIVTLIYGLVAIVTLLWLARNLEMPGLPWMIAGIGCIGAAYVFTVLEGFFWHDLFDVLEHCSYSLSGIGFCIGVAMLARSGPEGEDQAP